MDRLGRQMEIVPINKLLLFLAVSCIGNTLLILGENCLTRATLSREKAEKCTYVP